MIHMFMGLPAPQTTISNRKDPISKCRERILACFSMGWWCGSVLKHLPGMHEALGLTPSTTKEKKEYRQQ